MHSRIDMTTEGPILEVPEVKQTSWQRILVPVDFSDESKEAIKIAARLAEQSSAKITLLHVVELSCPDAIETGTMAYEAMDSARRTLDEMAGDLPTSLVCQKLVCFSAGGIARKIVETARDVSSDLIVLATHACGVFKRLLLGSTSESVKRHSPCPVLAVRQKPT